MPLSHTDDERSHRFNECVAKSGKLLTDFHGSEEQTDRQLAKAHKAIAASRRLLAEIVQKSPIGDHTGSHPTDDAV